MLLPTSHVFRFGKKHVLRVSPCEGEPVHTYRWESSNAAAGLAAAVCCPRPAWRWPPRLVATGLVAGLQGKWPALVSVTHVSIVGRPEALQIP